MAAKGKRSAEGYGYCGKCDIELTSETARPSVVKYGSGWCRKCSAAYAVAYSAAYYQEHREEREAYDAAYRREHRVRIAARVAAYNQSHREEIAAYYRAHRVRIAARVAAYRQEHPEGRRAVKARRRARKRAAAGDSNGAQRKARAEMYGGLCYLCGRPAEAMDHIIPLAKGGSNWPANLRPICTICNCIKQGHWPYDFEAHRQQYGYYPSQSTHSPFELGTKDT